MLTVGHRPGGRHTKTGEDFAAVPLCINTRGAGWWHHECVFVLQWVWGNLQQPTFHQRLPCGAKRH